jgi:8-oxo-dGTP diphosphatase
MGIGRFYAMVGALIHRPSDDKYLVLRRSEDKDFAGGSWECVTGRVDQGEGFSEAVHREVFEELGINIQIDFIVGTVHFYRGEEKPENEIIEVQYCCTILEPRAMRLTWEHAEHRWVTEKEAQDLLPEDHWLLDVIQRADAIRALSPISLQEFYHEVGFEL